jgi:hypothetical protein
MAGLAHAGPDRPDCHRPARPPLRPLAFSAPAPPSTTSWPSPPRNGGGRRRELLGHVGNIEEKDRARRGLERRCGSPKVKPRCSDPPTLADAARGATALAQRLAPPTLCPRCRTSMRPLVPI